MRQDDSFTTLFNTLRGKAHELSGELLRPWLHSSVFHTQSTHISDYIDEAENNLKILSNIQSRSEPEFEVQAAYLSERVTQQLEALTRALYRTKPPISESASEIRQAYSAKTQTKVTSTNPETLKKLYSTLTQYKGYEQRLEDQLRLAQQSNDKNQQELVLKAQQRLLRCQRAIVDIEKKIYWCEKALTPDID
ncbi:MULTISPECIES: primosomal replication protein PriC [Gammaproteobacteria]|uniref:primosomal replication protein PriC n=1 Tax=Gammaproteobacteria TaxID=1236 RepID=UPI000DCF9C87|nr:MULTISPECIES: primosomal replication protein PriC [Gammaproteobacteria]RTE86002.1 hypothetical protein DQX04_05355 [Aliidiomarina sp. B3213]TCZ91356.1 hypothetical protein EYQ95_05365 [Lysobacter sp. N42]